MNSQEHRWVDLSDISAETMRVLRDVIWRVPCDNCFMGAVPNLESVVEREVMPGFIVHECEMLQCTECVGAGFFVRWSMN